MGNLDLTTLLENLKMDEIHVDTKLAEQYLANNESDFHSLNFEEANTISMTDNYGNMIHCNDVTNLSLPATSGLNIKSWTLIQEKIKKLAVEIIKNADLFCQLEWLIRNIHVDDTKRSINLIVKNLLHASTDMKAAYIQEEIIVIQDDTPILVLGFVAQIFKTCEDPIIVCTKETAVVCHLFTELCQKVGWTVHFIIVDQLNNMNKLEANFKENRVYPNLFNGFLPQVTGVITERSDLDSAVEAFLNAGYHPMPLTRIFIQESVYEEFKNDIAWKCKAHHEKNSEITNQLKSQSTESFKYGNKVFLFNFAGKTDNIENEALQIVFVEAYRTVKELLSFINEFNQLCLSVWVNGISEANEIALYVEAPIIWVNDYCNFNGPDEVCKAIFKRIDTLAVTVNSNDSIVKMMKNQEIWSKKSFTERCEIVLKIIKDINSSLGDKIELDMYNWKINNFTSIDNNNMILGFNVPDKAVIYHTVGSVAVPSPSFDNIIRALINGSGVVIASEPKNEEEIFIGLEKEGVPVGFQGSENETNELEVQIPLGDSWCFQTKVIWTNFGTIFAN